MSVLSPADAPSAAPVSDRPVLVTGAAGFIGSHVVEALLDQGRRVVGVDNFDPFYDPAIKRRHLAAIRKHRAADRFEFVDGDICQSEQCGGLMLRARPESVIHLAAKAGVRPSIADPSGYVRANVLGTQQVLESARQAGVTRVVLASSSSVYGNNTKVPFSEDDDVSAPISPYAATKRACELIAFTHWRLTGMPTACLRFFTVYGPRQRPDLAIGSFLRKAAGGEDIAMFGDGSTSRDYTFVSDTVAGVLAALKAIDQHGYRVWNLGGSQPVMLRDLIAAVGRVVGREARVRSLPNQPGDVERTWADPTRSRAELGYHPRVSLEDGLARQWAWMREQP